MSMQSKEFTASGSWIAPTGVSLVWLTAIGGGGGATYTYSLDGSGGHATYCAGGAGAGELITNLPVAVTPGQSYTVTIGSKGIGAQAFQTQPAAGTASTFNGFIALEAGPYLSAGFSDVNTGSGGGPGRARGQVDYGGSPGGYHQLQESGRHTGGSSGGRGNVGHTVDLNYTSSSLGGNLGGLQGGFSGGIADSDRPGGGGGGTLWGFTNGGAGNVGGTYSASSTAYGAGAGGSGSYQNGGLKVGGNGCDGYASLRWVGPPS